MAPSGTFPLALDELWATYPTNESWRAYEPTSPAVMNVIQWAAWFQDNTDFVSDILPGWVPITPRDVHRREWTRADVIEFEEYWRPFNLKQYLIGTLSPAVMAKETDYAVLYS